MTRRPIPKRPAPKAPKIPMPTAEAIRNIQAVEAHYRTGQIFLSDAEIFDLVMSTEAQKTAYGAAAARKIEAAFAAIDAC